MIEVFKSLPTADTLVAAETLATMPAEAQSGYSRDTIQIGRAHV